MLSYKRFWSSELFGSHGDTNSIQYVSLPLIMPWINMVEAGNGMGESTWEILYIYSWFRIFSLPMKMCPLVILGCLCSCTRCLFRKEEISRFCYRSVLYHQQSAQLRTHRQKGQMEPFILPELLHNTEHRISPSDSCIKPIISVWARQSFLFALHLCFISHCGIVSCTVEVPPEESSYNTLFPLPSGSPHCAVGLRVGSSSLGIRGLQTSGLWCRDLERWSQGCWECRSRCSCTKTGSQSCGESGNLFEVVWSSRN